MLICERAKENRTGRNSVTQTEAIGICLCLLSHVRSKVIREEIEFKIPMIGISVAEFSLKARLVIKLQLGKSVDNVILLVIVGAKPIRPKVGTANAEGKFLVDA